MKKGEEKGIESFLASLIGKELLKALGQLEDAELELEDVEIDVEKLELIFQPGMVMPKPRIVPEKPKEIVKEKFLPPKEEWLGKVVEITIGATPSEGGTRDRVIVIGGETAPPYHLFMENPPHPPIIAMDVFDMRIGLPKAIRKYFEEVMEDPAEWARFSVEKYGVNMINLHLVSIDPLLKDTTPEQAAKTVEEVLQAVKVPICVGGCGDPVKDLKVFEKVAEVAQGERILINSVTLDMDVKRAGEITKEHGHAIIAFTSMDLNRARELNRKLYDYLPKDSIVMDTTTAAVGYGIDYAFTIMERARLAALMGDEELQHPLAAAASNAWAAREAWIKLPPEWGPKDLRGPIWETLTALTLLLAGVDYFMMVHPIAVQLTQKVIDGLVKGKKGLPEDLYEWVSREV
ncbi:MAG TPA: CO dehydrogenase/acetyl-CoA synthase subunit delta [Candidatus Korarchaeota archaeon]|nr:CO dehydrogenase/acetyl-CoA synthase subunit delta [Candidatus Korarchaeota archaeon]